MKLKDKKIDAILDRVEEENTTDMTSTVSVDTAVQSLSNTSIEMMKELIKEDSDLMFVSVDGMEVEWEPQDDEYTTESYEERVMMYRKKIKDRINGMIGATALDKAVKIIGEMASGGDPKNG